jgi:hypothetical protein
MVQDIQMDAATRIGSVAAELLASFDEESPATDVYALLATLSSAQRTLAAAYDRLAAMHEKAARAAMREELANEDEPENPSWLAAEVSLREAADSARASGEHLQTAHSQNGIARWYSEIGADF